jgi:two-component system phosphate regulon sensor histidine kinase PhoR
MQAPPFSLWKSFGRIIAIQYGIILFGLALFGFSLRHIFAVTLSPTLRPDEIARALHHFDSYFAICYVATTFLLMALAIWSGRRIIFPMARLLAKAKSVLQEKKGASPDDEYDENFNEWSDLEHSIDSIRKDLESKAESLSIEREELSTLMGAISDAILAIDPQGKPLFFNSRFALLFGNEEQLSKRDILLWEIFRVPEVLEAFQLALTQGKTSAVKAIPIEKELGSKRFFSLSVSPLKKSSGDTYGAVGVFHDVTELKSAEQIRIDFVANVSHELRTPLTSIKGYTDTLLEDVKQGQEISRDFLGTIARNVDRLMNLIGDLLDLSSLESTDVLQKVQVNTEEITQRVMQQLRQNSETKSQQVEAQISASVVTADPKRLEQVLVNLIDNAMKYTPKGGRILVRWEQEQGDVLLKVVDNGPGIPAEHHSRLFERFYRVDKARSREQGGTGLGLAIVKHILQRHDGTVSVESKMGQGSTFICKFPAG